MEGEKEKPAFLGSAAPLPQSATSVDQVAELHASRGSMASISGGGIAAAVSE